MNGSYRAFWTLTPYNLNQGLQDMIGETRMHKLGGDLFKRVNVDYAIPRHPGTELVKPKRKRGEDLVFQSLVEIPGQEAALRGFTPFDERTVRIGIIFAAAQYLGCGQLEKPSLQFSRLVTSQENRAYWDRVETDPPEAWNSSVKDLEEDDYRRPNEEHNRKEPEESKKRYEAEKRKMEASWAELRKKAVKRAGDKAGRPRTVDRAVRSVPEPETRTTPAASRAQRKAGKAARKKNEPKGRRNCMADGVRWLCCGIFRRR